MAHLSTDRFYFVLFLGLIEGYSTECETLKQKIEELEDKKQALVLNLETTRNKLSDLETIHHEARSLREEIQRQHQLVEENAGGEAQGLPPLRYFLLPLGVALTGYLLRDYL